MDNSKVVAEKLAYTVPEFVRAFGISRTSVYELMKTGELATVKVAGRRLIPRLSAMRLLEQ
jgi:predicted DNA-binding transcriptional regulator AlpA